MVAGGRRGAPETVRGLVRTGVTHVVGVPDNTSAPLFDEVVRHPTMRLVPVTREGEAFAVASGLWLGGAGPLVVIQNTGLLESGDALRGTAMRMAAPIPIVVTGRGWSKMVRAGVGTSDERSLDLLTRADVDSTALLTGPTLDAWGVPWEVCADGDDAVAAIEELVEEARSSGRPTALVLVRDLP